MPALRTGATGKSLMDWQKRQPGGALARFRATGHHGDKSQAALRVDHPAVIEGRTLFPSRVIDADDAPRVLVSGHNNAKIGRVVEKGPWAGMPIYTLTLEERATCPRTCENWRTCFGNSMPMPRRHRAGPDLERAIDLELAVLAEAHPQGFVVRLHILGDFYSVAYAIEWECWLANIPALHVFGYTARLPGTEIGDQIARMNADYPKRWAVRFSVARNLPVGPMQVATVWNGRDGKLGPERIGELPCPQQFDKAATCGTCGACWAEPLKGRRITFVGHGMRKRGAAKV